MRAQPQAHTLFPKYRDGQLHFLCLPVDPHGAVPRVARAGAPDGRLPRIHIRRYAHQGYGGPTLLSVVAHGQTILACVSPTADGSGAAQPFEWTQEARHQFERLMAAKVSVLKKKCVKQVTSMACARRCCLFRLRSCGTVAVLRHVSAARPVISTVARTIARHCRPVPPTYSFHHRV
jgi:hypothetical protein